MDAPLDVLLACKSEDQAVRICLNIALNQFGRDQQTVALICGWKSDSCLSEIASPRHGRKMPKTKREWFARATGCNLLSQFIAYQEAKANNGGTPTERQQTEIAAAACLSAWKNAA